MRLIGAIAIVRASITVVVKRHIIYNDDDDGQNTRMIIHLADHVLLFENYEVPIQQIILACRATTRSLSTVINSVRALRRYVDRHRRAESVCPRNGARLVRGSTEKKAALVASGILASVHGGANTDGKR